MSDIKETFDESEYDYDKITGGEEGGMSISSDLIRGHINTIILRSLYDGDKYGYDILSEIESKTGGLYSIKQPTLYSALKRLESLRYVASYYGEFSNGGRRKYFRLTDEGKEFVKKSLSEWEYSRTIIDSLITKGYVAEDGKRLISTELGRELYRILPDEIKKADMTAKWWAIQEDIRSGDKTYKSLTDNVLDTIKTVISNSYPAVNQAVMTKAVTEKYHEVIGTCPLCGGNVIEGTRGFGCSNWREPMNCKFTVWKNQTKGMFSNVTITLPMAKKLLAGKSVRMKKLLKNDGTTFDADVELKVDKESQYPVQFVFAPPKPLGKCPKCNGDVVESMKAFSCNNNCGFIIWKKSDRGLFKKTTITQTMVKKWLAGDKVRCNKLMGKNDTEFKADVTMKYNPDSVYNAPDFTLEFVNDEKKDVSQ
mgnify:CR=1 FL=1